MSYLSRKSRQTQKTARKTRLHLETLESRELLTVNSTMAQALALVPDSALTAVAFQSGSWSDPNTWQNGAVPDANANVLIPSQITVTLDTNSNPVHTVRVDGTLQFETDVDTNLVVDTLVVNMAGSLVIGTVANPIPANHHAAITFTSGSPIDRTWDPMGLSRGLLALSNAATDAAGTARVDPPPGRLG